MKSKHYVLYVVLVALLAGVVDLVTNLLQSAAVFAPSTISLTFISFVAWALYFLVGSSLSGGAKAFVSILFGAIAAVAMFMLSIAFGFTPWWAVPVAVVIVVLFMMPLEKLKFVSLASVFAGTGLFFAANAAGVLSTFTIADYLNCILAEMLYVFIGLAAGWLTIQFYMFCSKLSADKTAADKA